MTNEEIRAEFVRLAPKEWNAKIEPDLNTLEFGGVPGMIRHQIGVRIADAHRAAFDLLKYLADTSRISPEPNIAWAPAGRVWFVHAHPHNHEHAEPICAVLLTCIDQWKS